MKLNLETITDPVIRDNFKKLQEEFYSNPFMNGNMKHFELTLTQAETNYAFKHNLGYKPKDVLITFVEDASAVTVDYDLTNKDFIYFTFPAATTIRFFAGRVAGRQEVL